MFVNYDEFKKYSKGSGRKVEITCEKCKKTRLKTVAELYKFNRHLPDSTHGCVHCKKDVAERNNLLKYGVKNTSQLPEVRAKHRASCLKNLGVEFPMQNKDVQSKNKKTNLIRYGVECSLQNPEIRKKSLTTLFNNYGVDSANKNESIKLKGIKTKLRIYGTLHPRINKEENKLKDFLNSFGFNFISDYDLLSGKEIDAYDINLKLGIEYCGLYYHNELSPNPRDKDYHNNKRLKCEAQGVRLITIFEDEWRRRNSQVKGYLKAILNKTNFKIYARKCLVKDIDKKEANAFINKYHIQGANLLGIYFAGLYYKEELVGVMSFGKHPRNFRKLTLDRLCFREDYSIIGGASKMFVYLTKKFDIHEIISWSDNRWSQGNVYNALGFNLDEELPPDYSYVYIKNPVERLSKHSQMKRNTKCPIDKTELEWATERGLARIWDCGKKRWIWKS